MLIVDKEICRCEGDFISPVFRRPKKDGNRRMILNLKQRDSFAVYQNFKMEASVDLKDAFFFMPVHPEYQKYFKFYWEGKYYHFQGMRKGYGPAMRLFDKQFSTLIENPHIENPHSVHLEKNRVIHQSSLWLIHIYKATLNLNVNIMFRPQSTIYLLRKLGFTFNDEKSVFILTQVIEFWGFIISSLDMTIKLNKMKIAGIKKKIIELLSSKMLQSET